MQQNKRYLACLFLFLFLFPQIKKELHSFEHAKDVHCDVKSETHLHSLEHFCSLCDYTPGISATLPINSYQAILPTFAAYCPFYSYRFVSVESTCYLQLRAPPNV